jgi:hypothetical protein
MTPLTGIVAGRTTTSGLEPNLIAPGGAELAWWSCPVMADSQPGSSPCLMATMGKWR